ncbi:hypothetical protein Tcan_00770, partial [Toxocara canis]
RNTTEVHLQVRNPSAAPLTPYSCCCCCSCCTCFTQYWLRIQMPRTLTPTSTNNPKRRRSPQIHLAGQPTYRLTAISCPHLMPPTNSYKRLQNSCNSRCRLTLSTFVLRPFPT